jgi:hypothetical protein
MKIIRHTVIDDLKVDHKRLLRTMLVCQRFYAIAVATADIWTEINLDWPIVWVLQYMERSKGCPLRLRTRLMSCIEDSCIESAINRAESLDAWLYAGSHRRLLLALKKGTSRSFHTLSLRSFRMNHKRFVRDDFLSSNMCSHLSSLVLVNQQVASFPNMLALTHIKLESIICSISQIVHLFNCSNLLKSIVVNDYRDPPDGITLGYYIPAPDRCKLPHLSRLQIKAPLALAAMLLRMLPTPKDTLSVTVMSARGAREPTQWASSSEHEDFASRLEEFWAPAAELGETLPPGELLLHGRYNSCDAITLLVNGSAHGITLQYQSSSIQVAPRILARVTRVVLHCSNAEYGALAIPVRELLHLRGVQTLVIQHSFRATGPQGADYVTTSAAQGLKAWVQDPRCLVQTILFRQCHEKELRMVMEDLAQKAKAAVVTWED